MTLGELIELLQETEESHDFDDPDVRDPEVLVAYQPTYPMQARIAGIRVVDGTVYVVCEQGADYAPRGVYE